MNNEITIIITISLLIFATPFISKITRLPTSVLEIILGSIAGFMALLPHIELFELLAEFGFLYLMFLAGLEVDLKKVFTTQKDIIYKGLLYLATLYILAFAISKYMKFSDIFIVVMPLISVGLIAALKKEYGKNLTWLNISMIIGSLGEVVSIAALTLVSAGLQFGFGIKFYETIFYLSMFLLLILGAFKFLQILFWWYPELKTTLMPKIDSEEQDIRLSMALLFIFIAIMLYLDLEVAFGAFIAGIFIATFFEHKKALPHKLSSFGFGFLVPIFFIYTGSSFKLSALTMEGLLLQALLITVLMTGIRIIASMNFIKILGLKDSILFGLSHSMPLTLLVAVATLAYHTKSIDEFHYLAFILASLFEVLFVMIAIRLLQKKENITKNEKT
ncbi:cation:proton antiporter [Nitrosophilus alvini]|uniref:cation:proton antiporter n=1 Tax=Nitrosophilus alvini TaxID=2714855 RepID=UPI00190C996B|nr:cation:proton antiporter [Nitrosophilus alvini]